MPPCHPVITIDNEEYNFPLDVRRKPASLWLWPRRILILAAVIAGGRRFGVRIPLGIIASVVSLMAGIYIYPFHLKKMHKLLPVLMARVDKEFKLIRLEMFKNVKGNILDVGCATGHYFKYYAANPNVNSIVAMEPDRRMHADLQKNADQYSAKISLTSSVIDDDFTKDNYEKFDGVILGNVLCEIDDYPAVLERISQLLKPGGKIYFQEHVLETDPARWYVKYFQNWLNFWWKRVVDGCQCNKRSIEVMRDMFPNWEIKSFTYYSAGMFLVSRMEVGMACKKR